LDVLILRNSARYRAGMHVFAGFMPRAASLSQRERDLTVESGLALVRISEF